MIMNTMTIKRKKFLPFLQSQTLYAKKTDEFNTENNNEKITNFYDSIAFCYR